METNSCLNTSNNLHKGRGAQRLRITQQVDFGEKKTCTLEEVNNILFSVRTEYHTCFQARSSSDVNQYFPAKINGLILDFSCYTCDRTHLLLTSSGVLLDENMIHFPAETKHWRQGWFVVIQKGDGRGERETYLQGEM